MAVVFRSDPLKTELFPGPNGTGFAPLDDTYEVSWLPVLDSVHETEDGKPLLAHLTYRDALAVAAQHNARLITPAELELLRQHGHVIAPAILPDAHWRSLYPVNDADRARAAASRVPTTPEAERDQRLRNAFMTSLEWAVYHDAKVWDRLRDWTQKAPVLGAGKHWIAGAPSGRAWLMGWWDGKRWIQGASTGDGPHADNHFDYATTTMLIRRADGKPIDGGGPIAAPGGGASAGAVGGFVVALVVALVGGVAAWIHMRRTSSRKNARRRRKP